MRTLNQQLEKVDKEGSEITEGVDKISTDHLLLSTTVLITEN